MGQIKNIKLHIVTDIKCSKIFRMAAIEAIIKQLSVPVLKAELSKRGLQVKGKKDELVRILLSAIEEEVGEEVENVEEPMEDDGQDSAVGICLEDEPQG